ncbi:MAG: hypothetical protein ABFD60_08070 [Bryobacteraceae bacterium]
MFEKAGGNLPRTAIQLSVMEVRRQPSEGDDGRGPKFLVHAPEELLRGRLRRLGEGIGRVVFASEHWVVKRDRSPSEMIALVLLWRAARRLERILPARFRFRFFTKPSTTLRILRVLTQLVVPALPRGVWYATHIREVWLTHYKREVRGKRLAGRHLTGTHLVPERIAFPPVRVAVGGWPGWLVVSEAIERVEATLEQRLTELSNAGRFDELELWLDRFLEMRLAGWQRGVFSVDAHLKNFGVTGDRVVIIDAGGLTDRWKDIEQRMDIEEATEEPHVRLGLGPLLASRPDIADRFNAQWKATVNLDEVRRHWPEASD